MTPSQRPHAEKIQQHHMFYTGKEWRYAGIPASRVRMLGAFIVPALGVQHDLLHARIEPIKPPLKEVLDVIYEMGITEPAGKPMDRIGNIVEQLAKEAIYETSYEQSDQLLEVAYHLNAQRGILVL